MKIIVVPNKILNTKSEPIDKFDKKFSQVIRNMEKTLDATFDPKGVGLSAPQVGISKRFFIIKPTSSAKLQVIANPEILIAKDTKSKEDKKLLEGCLSIPNIWGNVKRPNFIKIKYRDMKGNVQTEVHEGFIAAVVQHEIDHLDGILFTQRVMEQNEQLYRSSKNEKGEDVFDEIEI